jgi:hypothetical protein
MLTVLTQTSEVVNCMTAENTVSRSELAQAAGMFRACHSSSLGTFAREGRSGTRIIRVSHTKDAVSTVSIVSAGSSNGSGRNQSVAPGIRD